MVLFGGEERIEQIRERRLGRSRRGGRRRGGYRRRELWDYPFVNDGRGVPWAQAMGRMIDRTGRPGPSTWEAGEYRTGQENHPVAGVSWYEAAAFAKFAGKSLPTVAH